MVTLLYPYLPFDTFALDLISSLISLSLSIAGSSFIFHSQYDDFGKSAIFNHSHTLISGYFFCNLRIIFVFSLPLFPLLAARFVAFFRKLSSFLGVYFLPLALLILLFHFRLLDYLVQTSYLIYSYFFYAFLYYFLAQIDRAFDKFFPNYILLIHC